MSYTQSMGVKAVFCVATPVLAALASNAIIALKGWGRKATKASQQRMRGLPPGWVIGTVWVLIFGLLGWVWFLVWGSPLAHAAVVALILYCLAYPLATGGLRNGTVAKVLNVLALVFSFTTALVTQRALPKTVWFLTPILAWTAYVNMVQAVNCSA